MTHVADASPAAHRLVAKRAWLYGAPVVVCMLWGGNVVAIRMALDSVPPFRMAALRSLLAVAILWGWAAACGGRLRVPISNGRSILVISILGTAYYALYYLALKYASASHVAVLVYLYPIVTALMASGLLPGDRLTARVVFGFLVAFLGAAVTLGDGQGNGMPAMPTGEALAIASAVVWAVKTVSTKRMLDTTSPLAVALYPTLFAALAFASASALTESADPSHYTWPVLVSLAYQGVVVAAGCNIAWVLLLKHLRASILASYTFLTPVFGVAASVLLLEEPLSGTLVLGLALVVTGLLSIQRQR